MNAESPQQSTHATATGSAGGEASVERNNTSPLSGPLGLVVALVLLSTAGYLSYKAFTTSDPVDLDSPSVVYICSESLKTFPYQPKEGDKQPIESPYSKKRTGYRAEACYWADSNKTMKNQYPAYVLLNEYVNKPGPTICPDCGGIVQPHNEMPGPDVPYAPAKPATDKNSPTTQPADDDD